VLHIISGPSFPWAMKFRAEPRNSLVAEEFPCFHKITQKLIKLQANNAIADVMS